MNNLRAVYLQLPADQKAVEVLTLLLAGAPDSAEEYKQRGILRLRLGKYPGAVADLERYLKLAPLAADHAEIRAHLDRLRRWMAARN